MTTDTKTRAQAVSNVFARPPLGEPARDRPYPPVRHESRSEAGFGLALLLMPFLACFIAAATFFQTRSSSLPPWVDGAPIEYFTGSLLWLLSVICLVTASRYPLASQRFIRWTLASAGLGVLALDEMFALHEIAGDLGGNDDYIKVVFWAASALALYMACRCENPPRLHRHAIAIGYLFHSLYILVELGDGDLFQLAVIPHTAMMWVEEYLELLFLSFYFFGLVSFLAPDRNVRAD